MNKTDFIKTINGFHSNKNQVRCINFLRDTTRLSETLCKKITQSLWNCSEPKHIGSNIYALIKDSAEDIEFTPKLKKGCDIYFFYLDEHTASFAIQKIKQYVCDFERWNN